ncbi:hypothetical protein HPB48_013523 [Haemaphysalis longicornis]|uniref:Methyltransferase type 11 domain-containing protein n=1 Tax=Haemaphysalis longicornis TaxID=44386 RepID=A0A9J6G9S4_HAELO|nr:hypothetical protein HPB48_013523 [Haemaphysalis longicornis]
MEQPVRESHRDFLDAKAFERFKDYSLKVDTDALGRITFEHAPREDHAHLDIGCGPGTFTKDFLLPCSEPCARLVAIDNSPLMIEFAMENFNDEKLAYEVFDFGRMEAGELVKKHGHFDRVYSFLCFHLVKDQWKCFRDIATLLTPKHGECVVAFFMSFPLADAWLQVHSMNRWSDLIPDPRPLFSGQLRYNFNGSPDKMECEVREMVRASGLTCVACHVYETEWAFPNAETYVGVKKDRVAELKTPLLRHLQYPTAKLETLIRLLDNGTPKVSKINDIKDDVEYSCHDPHLEENGFPYDDLDLRDIAGHCDEGRRVRRCRARGKGHCGRSHH